MSTTGDETSGDYAYDMAHEDVSPPPPSRDRTPSGHVPESPVTEETPEADGDYSYDLAHEVPRSGQGPSGS
jgi:hypothetical protein